MVISRPAFDRDVGYRMVARPLLRRLEAISGDVDLVVLRPPTLDRLREMLKEAQAAGRPFQVVHFDGHGAFNNLRMQVISGGPVTLQGSTPQGVLVLRSRTGTRTGYQPIGSRRVLAQARCRWWSSMPASPVRGAVMLKLASRPGYCSRALPRWWRMCHAGVRLVRVRVRVSASQAANSCRSPPVPATASTTGYPKRNVVRPSTHKSGKSALIVV